MEDTKYQRPEGISDSSDYESEEDDVFEEAYMKKLQDRKSKKTMRISVSAEAYG